jgi:hypothetical protein
MGGTRIGENLKVEVRVCSSSSFGLALEIIAIYDNPMINFKDRESY